MGWFYFLLPNRPRMMELAPERMTELRALVAARLAMVPALVVLPPVTELTMLWLTAVITEEVALVTAFWATFFLAAASFSACFWAAASSFRRCFSASASSFRRYFSAAASSASC